MIKLSLPKVVAVLFACLGANAIALGQTPAQAPLSIAICDDENELPPFSYLVRQAGATTPVIGGFAVSVVREIFARRGVHYRIDIKPWSRCVALATIGAEYGMLMNMTHSLEREKSFLFSRPFSSTRSYYYYARERHPNGLDIASPADLHNYRVCGIAGHNYRDYGMAPGEIDQGARNLETLIHKLKLGRCTLFLEKDEIMSGYAMQGKAYYPDPAIAKAPVPGMKPSPFYFGISRRYPRAAELRQLIDEELLLLESSGRLAELWKASATPPRP